MSIYSTQDTGLRAQYTRIYAIQDTQLEKQLAITFANLYCSMKEINGSLF